MALKLRSHTNPYPPDGFYFDESGPIPRHFQAEGGIRQLATRVHEFRTANKLPNSSWEACFADIEQFTIARLGNDPKWVIDTEQAYAPQSRQREGGGCCGAKVA